MLGINLLEIVLFSLTMVGWALNVMMLLLLIRVILQWARMSSQHQVMKVIVMITDPVLAPVRKWQGQGNSFVAVPGGAGYIDITPLSAMMVLWLIRFVLNFLAQLLRVPPLWLFSPFRDFGGWLAGVVGIGFDLYLLAILMRIVLAWLRVSYATPVMRFLWRITEPLLSLIRRRLPIVAGIDFTPLVAMLLLSITRALTVGLILFVVGAFSMLFSAR